MEATTCTVPRDAQCSLSWAGITGVGDSLTPWGMPCHCPLQPEGRWKSRAWVKDRMLNWTRPSDFLASYQLAHRPGLWPLITLCSTALPPAPQALSSDLSWLPCRLEVKVRAGDHGLLPHVHRWPFHWGCLESMRSHGTDNRQALEARLPQGFGHPCHSALFFHACYTHTSRRQFKNIMAQYT